MKKTSKYLILLSIIVLFSCLPFAHATESIAYNQDPGTSSYTTVPNTNHAHGVTFHGNDEFLTRALFYIGSDADYTGNIGAVLVQGTGSSGYMSSIVEGGPYNETSIDTYSIAFEGYQWLEFRFSGTVNLTSTGTDGTEWCIMVYNINWLSHGLNWKYKTAPNTYATIGDSGGSTGWNGPGCTVYTSDVSLVATPEPLPTGTPYDTSTDTEQLYADLVNFFVPVFVMILPALLLWWLGGRGKWPLLIGLAIGTGIAYVFVANFPLWLVFLVAIGIIGMAYSDVAGGGAYT